MIFDSLVGMILDMAEYKGKILPSDNPADLSIGFIGEESFDSKEWRIRLSSLKSPKNQWAWKYLCSCEKRLEFASRVSEIVQKEQLYRKSEAENKCVDNENGEVLLEF